MANTSGVPGDVIRDLDAPLANLKDFLFAYLPADAEVIATVAGKEKAFIRVSAKGDIRLATTTRNFIVKALTTAGFPAAITQAGRRKGDSSAFFQVTSTNGIVSIVDFRNSP